LTLALAPLAAPGAGAQIGEYERPTPEPVAAETPDIETLAYTVEIAGVEDPALQDLLTQVSQLVALRERPPATLAALERRAEEDLERFREALRSEGFYASTLDLRIDETARPVAVVAEIDPGNSYLLADYQVVYVGAPAPEPALPEALADLGLELGALARAPDIVGAERQLLRDLKDNGHPLARIVERRSLVDHAQATMTVTLNVDAGPYARFGPVVLQGLENVEEDYPRRLLPWTEGEPYDQRLVEEARQALSATELFDSVTIDLAETVDAQGLLPMTITLVERDQRSIGAGVSYSTDVGAGADLFWEHRNILGRNERLRLSARAAQTEQSANANFRKPLFLRLDQALLANAAATQRQTDAFDEQSLRGYVGLERSFGPLWTTSGGASLEYASLEDELGETTFLLYGFPVTAARDSRDDLLNASKGTRLSLAVTPYFGNVTDSVIEKESVIADDVLFLVNELHGSAYYAIDEEKRFILAARSRLGSIVGEETEVLPANKRFYAGGGGSVRGYAFQFVGPLDKDGDPLGGRSVVEVGGELRWRPLDDFGVVPFVEGGMVGDSPLPDFEEEFLWAFGLGLRYFTGVGPLRLDVAFPINPRENDDFFQFYVSFGQAF